MFYETDLFLKKDAWLLHKHFAGQNAVIVYFSGLLNKGFLFNFFLYNLNLIVSTKLLHEEKETNYLKNTNYGMIKA